jgi:hypothetical protein
MKEHNCSLDFLRSRFESKEYAEAIEIIKNCPSFQFDHISDDRDAEVFAIASTSFYNIHDYESAIKATVKLIDYIITNNQTEGASEQLEHLLVIHNNARIKLQHPFKGYLFLRSVHRQIDLGRFPVVNRQFTQFLDSLVHRFQRWSTVTLVGWTVLLLALHEVIGLIHISFYFPLLILSLVLVIVLYVSGKSIERIIRKILL